MSTPRVSRRVLADPSISCGDMSQAILHWCRDEGSLDLWGMLLPSQKQRTGSLFKKAIDVDWLSKLSGLHARLAAIAPNGVLLQTKVKRAVVLAQAEKVLNTRKKNEVEFADDTDYFILLPSASSGG